MYDDLARTQRPSPLEWFVVNAVIPTLVVTLALQVTSPRRASPPTNPADDNVRGWLFTVCGMPPLGRIPDVFPTLVRMPRPVYPDAMRRAGIEGRVVLRALVNTSGRVDSSSILVMRATRVEFVVPARQALQAALFRPGWFGGQRLDAWITIAIDFPNRSE